MTFFPIGFNRASSNKREQKEKRHLFTALLKDEPLQYKNDRYCLQP